MGEAVVIHGPYDGQFTGVFGEVREEIRDLDIAVAAEFSAGAEHGTFFESGELQANITEAGRHKLPVHFVEQGLGVEGVEVAGTAMHEEGDDALGSASFGLMASQNGVGGECAKAHAGAGQEFAAVTVNRHRGTRSC